MRILHLDSGREMRGGQWQVLRLHRGLIEAGHESMLLARESGPLLRTAEKAGLPCDVLSALHVRGGSEDYDVLHAHDARAHTLAAVFSRRPFVVSRRVAFAVKRGILSRWKYQQAARFLAVSNFVATELRNAGVRPEIIDTVYDGVPVPEIAAQGDAILTPYSGDPGKLMDLALEAGNRAKLPITVSRNLGQDLPAARAFVYLSRSEGLGSGILLAMAHGVTVVASRTGGILELIEDGVTGILTENDPAAVAQSLNRIDRRLGDAGRLQVMSRFTVAHMVAATLRSYERA